MKSFSFGRKLFAAATLLSLASCASEAPWGTEPDPDATGGILLQLSTSGRLLMGVEDTRADDTQTLTTPPVEAFGIRLTKQGGETKTYQTIADFQKESKFAVGTYSIEAFYGKPDDQGHCGSGYDNAYYYGVVDNVMVVENEKTVVEVGAALSNSAVQVSYGEAFKKYFTSWSTTLQTTGCDPVELKDSEAIHFLTPGEEVTVTIEATFQNGKTTRISPAKFKAKAQCLQKIKYEIFNGEVGTVELKISFPEDVVKEDVIVPLSDELGGVALPSIALDGFDPESTTPLVIQSGIQSTTPLAFNLLASAGFENAVLTISSNSYKTDWLNEGAIDLCKAQTDLVQKAANAGVRCVGLNDAEGTLAKVDISKLLVNLPAGKHDISMQVTDKSGQVSEVATIKLETQTIKTEILEAVSELGSGLASIKLSYDGPDPTQPGMNPFSFKYHDGFGYDEARIVSINDQPYTRAFEAKEYVYVIQIRDRDDVDAIPLEVLTNGRETGLKGEINYTYPAYSFVVDAMAKSVRFKFDGLDASKSKLLKNRMSIELGGQSRNYEFDEASGVMTIEGLAPDTDYRLDTWLSKGIERKGTASATFRTEAESQIPNGDFENLTETINIKINQGGKWGNMATSAPYQTTLTMVVSEPNGWLSSNSVTCNKDAKNQNSWYVIPSVYNATLSWVSHQPEAKVFGIGQSSYDSTAEIYKNIDAQSGSNAMIVRTVAWDFDGPGIPDDKKTGDTKGFSNYYCSKEPTIANRTSGKLYLGSNGSEGAEFTSRPKTLKGYYKYEAIDGEKGVVEIKVLAGNKVLASGKAELAAQTNYTLFSIPLISNYTFGDKATKLQITILSSNSVAPKTENHCNKEECCSRGSALTIDNLFLEY